MVPLRKEKGLLMPDMSKKSYFIDAQKHLRDHLSSPKFPASNTNNALKFLQTDVTETDRQTYL